MITKADLHLHTNYSDGVFSVSEIAEKTKKAGLSVISFTDHDNIGAVEEFYKFKIKIGLEIIPGIEFSADFKGKEIHILAYFIDYKSKKLKEFLKAMRENRIKRLEQIIVKLKKLGCKIDGETFFEQAPENVSLGRPHLAILMVNKGFVKNYFDAFNKYLAENKPAYVQKPNPNIEDTLDLIESLGGLSFLAHPSKYLKSMNIEELLKLRFDGVEIIHPSHTHETVEYLLKLVSSNFLLVTGGSDFHGILQSDEENLGSFYITKADVLSMKRRLF